MGMFGATSGNSKIFQAGSAKASISGTKAVLLTVEFSVTRSIQPITTLTDGIWWSAQPVTGSLQAGTILVSSGGKDLLEKLTGPENMCTAQNITLKMKNSCDGGDATISINDAYCSSVSFTMNGGQGYIGSGFQASFTDCTIS